MAGMTWMVSIHKIELVGKNRRSSEGDPARMGQLQHRWSCRR